LGVDRFGYIIAGGFPALALVADVEVRTVLWTLAMASAARCAAGAVSFRNRPEECASCQLFDFPQQLFARLGTWRRLFHPLRHDCLNLAFLVRTIATKFCATTHEPT